MVIPNSKLVINPGARPEEWHKELYLRPGQWIPWVGATVLGAMIALAGVVLVLHLNEKVRVVVFLWMSSGTPFMVTFWGVFFSVRTSWNVVAYRIISTLTRYDYTYRYIISHFWVLDPSLYCMACYIPCDLLL
jgi:hypothetical protein